MSGITNRDSLMNIYFVLICGTFYSQWRYGFESEITQVMFGTSVIALFIFIICSVVIGGMKLIASNYTIVREDR